MLLRLVTLALALSACTPAAPAKHPLTPYEGHALALFDDAIEPSAVGLELESKAHAARDPLMRERVHVGDATVRAYIDTVTVKQEDAETSYQIGFHVVEKLAGMQASAETFTVRVGRQSPSFGIMKTYEGQLVGKKFIAFVRAFTEPDGDEVLHFHAVQDTPEVVAAVHGATPPAENR